MSPVIARHGFTAGLLLVILVAWIQPVTSLPKGWPVSLVTTTGVVFIFLLQGMSLPLSELRAGVMDGKFHRFVLGWNFLGMPLLAIGLSFLASGLLDPDLLLGFLYLALLPTTIASAIALTAVAGGRVAPALVATTFSNLIGVFLCPLATLWVINATIGLTIDPLPVLTQIGSQILLPVFCGQMIRTVAPAWVGRHRAKFRPTCSGIILLILYFVFSRSFAEGLWTRAGTPAVLGTLLLTCLLLGLGTYLIWRSAGWVGLQVADRISALYCASQKGLAIGVPMAGAILIGSDAAGKPDLGLFLLPLMCYHPLQLTLGGILANRFRNAT